jgi:hypothetical protein
MPEMASTTEHLQIFVGLIAEPVVRLVMHLELAIDLAPFTPVVGPLERAVPTPSPPGRQQIARIRQGAEGWNSFSP